MKRNKIAEIISQTHKTPLEQADEILLLFGVSGCLSEITFSYKHPTGKKIGKLEYDEDMLILRYKGGYIMNPELDKLIVLK